MYTEKSENGSGGGMWWNLINTALGAAGTATGITALATKVPKNNGGCRKNCGGSVYVNDGGGAPSAFQSWAKSCEDAIELTKAFYQGEISQMAAARQAREVDVQEKFSLWKGQVDADFGLYKEMRDRDDQILARISDLEMKVAVGAAIRPYQDALISCKIDKVADYGAYALDRRTCRMIEGELVLPNTPTVTGYPSYNRCSSNGSGTTTAQQ